MIVSRRWADRVFHVLAHVEATAALAPSVHDAGYVAFVERYAGPASDRPLAEDARVLGRTLTTHETLSQAQLLAWLFADEARAEACATRDLADLRSDEVDAPRLLPRLVSLGPVAEVLRCATHLEREAYARLPVVALDEPAIEAAIGELSTVAPALSGFDLACVRSLRLRGRVLGREIWIGTPGAAPWPSLEHVAWQAAHEATVSELQRELPSTDHETLERAALSRLQERAARHGKAAGHRRWRDHLAESWR